MKKLDLNTETQVVAMIARGDNYQKILDWLEREKGVSITKTTLTRIKERNAEGLDFMRKELVKHETTMAGTILEKSRRLIDQRLDRALNLDEEIAELRSKLDNEEIDEREYYSMLDTLLRSQLTVAELNSLTKESFNQSQVEAGRPTSITENPQQARANLESLLSAIQSNDQSKMLKAIFPDA
jgi:hypothetical protein